MTLSELAALVGDQSVMPLVDWANAIGSDVAAGYGHTSSSDAADEIRSAAVEELVTLAAKFDPDRYDGRGTRGDHFRGYAGRPVRTACVRAADNLRGGGTTKRTVRPTHRRSVGTMGDAAAAVADSRIQSPDADPVTRVRLNNTLYALPFERLLRPLTGQELHDLESSIELHGILDPVTTCDLEHYGPCVIDGGHRAAIAAGKGIPVPVNHYGLISDDLASILARTLNTHRRHLTADEVKAHKQAQAERVARMREQGMSLRAIGEIEGIPHATAVNRLASKGVTDVTPVTPASEAAKAAKALTVTFRILGRLMDMDRDQMFRLADECDIPITTDSRGAWKWPALGSLTVLRGMLERVT